MNQDTKPFGIIEKKLAAYPHYEWRACVFGGLSTLRG